MNLMKELFMEAYEEIIEEMEGITEKEAAELAHKRSVDKFADMCDQAKERKKYEQ